MKKVLKFLEQNEMKDPVVFSWNTMRSKGQIDDELAIINLIQALISNKNLAFRAMESLKNKGKIVEFKRTSK